MSAYYRGADAVIICYDITNRESFDHVEEWLSELARASNEHIVKLILGNKADDEENRKIQSEQGSNYAEKNNCEFIETSARTSTFVDAAFATIATRLMEVKKVNDKPKVNVQPEIVVRERKCC